MRWNSVARTPQEIADARTDWEKRPRFAQLSSECQNHEPGSSSPASDTFKSFEERRVLYPFASMGECPVAVLWVRRSETNRLSKCLEDTRGELARKGLTHRRMSNDSPKIQWSCQRVNELVGVGVPRQFSGRNGLLDKV